MKKKCMNEWINVCMINECMYECVQDKWVKGWKDE